VFSVRIFRWTLGANSCLSQLVQPTPDINEHKSCHRVNKNLLKSLHVWSLHAVIPSSLWDILSALRKNHGIIPWSGLEGTSKKDHLVPTPLPWAGIPSTRTGCSKPCPTWSWTLPGREHPQLLWATCSSASPPSDWRISSLYLI